jgi:DNA gyrase subunit B
MFGETLERSLQRMMAFRKLLQQVTRRGHPADVVSALLRADARDKAFFENRESLEAVANELTTPSRSVTVARDVEHNVFVLTVDDRAQGYSRTHQIGVDFVASGEYRTLHAAYREIRDVTFPVHVKATASAEVTPEEEPSEAAEGPGVEPAIKATSADRGRKEPDVTLEQADAFVDYFLAVGKKGVAVNRYKGLGEMNPDTLWLTTMDPEHRTLLQVRAEDHAEADQMFTTLMGDQVEPRRKFIEDNALDVRNLDV